NFNALLPDDFAVIREYLQRRSTLDTRARTDLSLKLARQAKDILGLQELPFQMTPDLFLEAIYLAYQRRI
ncbi:RDD family protein, partial [Pseudanabaenaceae cyanobacterium LEGE 13415]|nr:RDD family protein [Pseudanabaenaceae cyanobacterium LEGE 13415]